MFAQLGEKKITEDQEHFLSVRQGREISVPAMR